MSHGDDQSQIAPGANMGHLWCEEYGWKGLCRIDVVGVWMGIDGEIERIEHWENVQL